MQRPTLLNLCVQGVASNLLAHAPGLRMLPWELADIVLAEILAHRSKHKGIVAELQVFCELFWAPETISLSNVARVNCAGLVCLQSAKKGLHRLDLTGCGWLDSLYFLPGLSQLRCLNLRNCQRLPEDCLACIKSLPQLECLDLEDVGSITDAMAAYHIPGMPQLRALNVSGTGAADQLIEALTYGSRLRNWANERTGRFGAWGVRDTTTSTQSSSSLHNIQGLLHQWPSSQLAFLRFQRTMVTKESVVKLLALRNVVLVDARNTSIPSRSLAPLASRFGLTVLPENPKLLARSSGLMGATVRGVCGCCAVEGFPKPRTSARDPRKENHYALWERTGVEMMLQEASCVFSWPSSAEGFWMTQKTSSSYHPRNSC